MSTKIRIFASGLIAALALSGCGGQEESEPVPAQSTDAPSMSLREIELAMGERRYREAIVGAEQILSREPGHENARLLLVRAFLGDGRAEEAQQALEGLKPGPVTWPLEGEILLALGRPRAALVPLAQAISSKPQDQNCRYLMGRAQLGAGELEASIATLLPLAQGELPYLESQLHLSTALMRSGRTAEADSVREAHRVHKIWLEALALRSEGLARSEKGELEVALDYFNRSRELAPEDTDLPNDIGAVLARLGRMEEAAKEFLRAAELSPDDPTVQRNLANLYHIMGEETKRDAAIARYEELARQEQGP